VFAWKSFDMKGIPREVAKHKLNIKPGLNASETTPAPLQRREVKGHWQGHLEAP
jgi:hypothetical protein